MWQCVLGMKESGTEHPKKNDRGRMNQGRFVMASKISNPGIIELGQASDLDSDPFRVSTFGSPAKDVNTCSITYRS
jgi:hypothetical protein